MNISNMISKFFFPTMYNYKIDVIANKMPLKTLLKKNKHFEIAVQHDGWALKYICPKYRTYEMYCLVVEQNGCALKYIFLEYQTDKEINIDALVGTFKFKFHMIRKMKELCYFAFQQNPSALAYIPQEFQTEEICKLAIQHNAKLIMWIAPLNQTEELCKLAVQQNAFNLTGIRRQTENYVN